jgi:hypothetical protein
METLNMIPPNVPVSDLPQPSSDGTPLAGFPLNGQEHQSRLTQEHTSRIYSSYQVTIFGQPDTGASYLHGHIDGAFKGNQKAFEDYIEHDLRVKGLGQQVTQLRESLQHTEKQLADKHSVEEEIAKTQVTITWLEKQIPEVEAKLDTTRKTYEEKLKEDKDTREHGALLHASLYLLAGILFFLGDLIVSVHVVAQALRLGGDEGGGLVERWLFAAGIAALTFVIKPAYERFCEKPYWEGKDKWFRWVILLAAGLTLVTLGFLGYLRSDYVSEERQDTQTMPSDLTFNEATPTQVSLASGTDASWKQIVAFMSTSVLFALAGAICFGISTFYWRDWYHIRRPLRLQLQGPVRFFGKPSFSQPDGALRLDYSTPLPMQIELLEKEVTELRKLYLTRKQELACLQVRAGQKPDIEALRSRHEALAKAIDQCLADQEKALRMALQASYQSGYHLASENLVKTPPPAMTVAAMPGQSRKKRLRPYLRLRKMLVDASMPSRTAPQPDPAPMPNP